MRAPTLTELDGDSLTLIETGDWVRMDADADRAEI